MVNWLHFYSAFLNSGRSKRFTTLPNIHPFMHTFTDRRCRPLKATASSSGTVRVRCLAQGHLDTPLVGAGIEPATFWLPVNILYLLSHMPPTYSQSNGEGQTQVQATFNNRLQIRSADFPDPSWEPLPLERGVASTSSLPRWIKLTPAFEVQ